MKLVMFTSSYDTSLKEEGFIADWVNALSKEIDELVVILLNKPKTTTTIKNIKFYYLHKKTKLGKILEIWQILNKENRDKKIDGIFSHIFEFLAVISGLWGKINRVKTGYWYAGGIKLNFLSLNTLAFHMNDIVFTCSALEAKRYVYISKINIKKISVMNHAINIDYFKTTERKMSDDTCTIGYTCRCTRQKNIEALIQAAAMVNKPLLLKLALSRTQENPDYYNFIQQEMNKAQQTNHQLKIEILTNVNYSNLPEYYHSLDLYVHPSKMKSIDKAGLEAIASGLPVLLSSDGYGEILKKYPQNLFNSSNRIELSKKLEIALKNKMINSNIQQDVINQFSIKSFMTKLVSNYHES